MPPGGKRPGGGAKPGNLNALKHGRHSPRVRQLLTAALDLPELRQLLFLLRRQRQARDRAARQALRLLFPALDALLPPLPKRSTTPPLPRSELPPINTNPQKPSAAPSAPPV